MSNNIPTSPWQRWLSHPQRTSFRKILFQIHLWSGIALGLYIFFISVTGSVLVYRNELYVAVTREPVISTLPGTALSDDALVNEVLLSNPGFRVARIYRPSDPDQAAEIWLESENSNTKIHKRLFDTHNGEDVGSAENTGYQLVSGLIELHKEFLVGPVGKQINGVAAIAVLLVAFTGLIIWWPGSKRWKRSLIVHRSVGWKRLIWELHSMVGFWSFAFIVIFSFSGIYLSFPETFHRLADSWFPLTIENAGQRFIDRFLYWTAFLHFGRINGIGIPCSGPGLCDQSIKAVWAIFGLAPAAMFVTGVTMWWNRVLRRWWQRTSKSAQTA